MIYGFLSVGSTDPDALTRAVADALGVDPGAVDTADADGDLEGRDWDSPVLCDYAAVRGDVSALLEIQLQETVPGDAPDVAGAPTAPPLAELGAALARRLDTALLWHAEERIPSAYWVATPGGRVTRARVEQSDGPDLSFTVAAVEAAVPQLPRAHVRLLPEIFREEEILTPATDSFVAAADPRGTAQAEDPVNRAREGLMLWERLVRRMASGWAPTGRYPAELYVEGLRSRDHLARLEAAMPPVAHDLLAAAAKELDDVFRGHTQDDEGQLVSALPQVGPHAQAQVQAETKTQLHAPAPTWSTPAPGETDHGWWWRRRPVKVPWAEAETPHT